MSLGCVECFARGRDIKLSTISGQRNRSVVHPSRLIEQASTSISIASYQIRDDESGGQLLAALLDAASRGVEVRLLVDAHPNSNNLPKPLMRYLVEHGVCLKERPFDVRSKLEWGDLDFMTSCSSWIHQRSSLWTQPRARLLRFGQSPLH